MYVLVCLVPRAETTDTVIYYVAYEKEVLEEVLLSIYDEAIENQKRYEISDAVVKQYLDQFSILKVPIVI